MLLYSSKGVTATNQFKVHGQLPLHGMTVGAPPPLTHRVRVDQSGKRERELVK